MRWLVVVSAILLITPAWSQDNINGIQLTSQCEEQVAEHDVSEYKITGDTEINVSSRTDTKHSITQVWLAPFLWGLIFRAYEREILHCVHPFVYEDFILVEKDVDYSLFQLDEFNTVRFNIHSKVNCGSNCYYSRVDAVVIPDNKYFSPMGYVEFKTKRYEYPSRFFRAYLNEDERHLLDNIDE